MIRVFAIWVLCASAAAAQDWPALADVTGVSPDDVLNVRAAPSGDAPIVGALVHDARWVEVTASDGNWGRVNLAEGAGWAHLGYLAVQPGGTFPDAEQFRCFGTEPFWSIDVTPEGPALMTTPDGPYLAMEAGALRLTEGRFGPHGVWMGGAEVQGALTVRREECSDGMSDRAYGLGAQLMLGGQTSRLLSGCCTLQME
ncbi:COG3650 family protein [Aestuariicoccus sp. MJ-SS9]|uniref:COG3650 family protein n=1 Tax=Aestuariicoccus sp. MJ-SS9 TaxID=3079855 RepID=UPI002910E08A|nr:SH3 domain-containing protein [Aestuariicoccus sp. MJ-SS9]MDU8910196.1 SH3 domain-containing protein [Aestuariicoccus sp. MJ-SS9]